jgi:hypothetical protein
MSTLGAVFMHKTNNNNFGRASAGSQNAMINLGNQRTSGQNQQLPLGNDFTNYMQAATSAQ